MPDWSYHPVVRPALFRLRGESARGITMSLLSAQAHIPGGPALFRLLASAEPPKSTRTHFAGLTFPSPVGLGAGIDVDGRAAQLMQELGFGFLELGPVGASPHGASPDTDPVRLVRTHGLAMSESRAAPPIEEVLARLSTMRIPVGIRLGSRRHLESLEAAGTKANFASLPIGVGASRAELRDARSASELPLFVRVLASWDRAHVDRVIDNALATGINGAIVVAGAPYPDLRDGELTCPSTLPDALEVVARVGDRLPVAVAGGVLTPEDAETALAAGAGLIFLSDGLVFAGPGLPKRINRFISRPSPTASTPVDPPVGSAVGGPRLALAMEAPGHAAVVEPAPVRPNISELLPTRVKAQSVGLALLVAAAGALLASGFAYLFLAATIQLLPGEARSIGMTVPQLCRIDDCRLVDFIAHGRACYGGVLVAVGTMATWLAIGPLRRGETWAWWALLFAGIAIQGSYISSIVNPHYVATPGLVATLTVVVLWTAGLLLTFPRARNRQGPIAAFRVPSARAWRWSPAGRGRLLIFLFAAGLATGGSMILTISASDVFVPQDLAFMGIGPDRLDALSDQLIPVMAYDRGGFGGGLLALGILFAATAQKGLRPGGRGAWRAIGIAGSALIVFVFAAHLAVDYTSAVHLSPVYSGAVLLALLLVTLNTPLGSRGGDPAKFPDV